MRWYLPDKNEQSEHRGIITGGGMTKGQNPDKPQMVQVPPMFHVRGPGGLVTNTEIALKPGGVAFGLVDYGFFHVAPGDSIDLPDNVPSHCIRNMAPQLLSKEQAIKAGLANEDGSLVKKDPGEKQPKQSKQQPQ